MKRRERIKGRRRLRYFHLAVNQKIQEGRQRRRWTTNERANERTNEDEPGPNEDERGGRTGKSNLPPTDENVLLWPCISKSNNRKVTITIFVLSDEMYCNEITNLTRNQTIVIPQWPNKIQRFRSFSSFFLLFLFFFPAAAATAAAVDYKYRLESWSAN